jgi:molybdate transport repressor ModE-like protein
MDTLEQIRIFVLAVRTGSFSEAGRQMDLSPATVSRYIQSLEERFASRLLNRSSRGLSLTHAGEVLMERATRVLQEFDEIEPAVTDLSKSPQGRLHVHAREFVGHHLIVPFVAHFLESHPAIEIVLTLADRPLDLIENNIDISIRTERSGEIEHLSLVTRKLGSWPRVVCASPAYLRRHGTPTLPRELEQHDCLTYQFHQAAPVWRFRRGGEEEQVKVRTKVQSSSGEALRQLALSGQGVVLMPQWSVLADIAAGRLVVLFEGHDTTPTDAPFQHNIFAVYQPARHQSPKLKTFLQSLVRSMPSATTRENPGGK